MLVYSIMVVDVLSMVSLTVIFEGISIRSVITLAIFIVGLMYFPQVGNWFFKRYHAGNVEFQSRFILVIMLSLILVAQVIEMHLAIIAFISGSMLSEIIKNNHQLEMDLKAVIFGFMAPLFLFQAGLSIDLSQISMATLKEAAVLGTVAFTAKYLATRFAFRRYFKDMVGKFAGLLFNYRLSFGIIVASFGLSEGLIDQDIYIGVLKGVVSSAVLATLVMNSKWAKVLAPVNFLARSVIGTGKHVGERTMGMMRKK